MGVAVSSYCFISAAPSSSCPSPAPGWGPTHKTQSFTNFSNMGPSHGLPFFMNCSSMGPFHALQSFRNGLLQCGSPVGPHVQLENLLLCGPLSMGHSFYQKPAAVWVLHRLQLPSGHLHLLCYEVLCGLQSGYPLHRSPPWVARGQAVSPLSSAGLQGYLCCGSCSTSSPSVFTDLGVCRVVAVTFLTPPLAAAHCFFPFLKYVITEALPMLLTGSALASSGSILEAAATGSFCHLLTEAIRAALQYQNLAR